MIPLRDDNSSASKPVVTVALLAIATLVFFWQLSVGPGAGETVVYALGLIPGALFGEHELPERLAIVPPSATILTSMFLHGGWLHLLGDMLFLWIYGDNVEDAMGHARFLLLVCGIAAALAQALPDPHSTVPMIGASGAISGVLGAYLLLFPSSRILVLIPLGLFLHTSIVLIWWFVIQFVSTATPSGGGVAFRAHVGGFTALVAVFKRPGVRLFKPLRA